MYRFLIVILTSTLFLSTAFINDAHAQRNSGSFGIGVGSTTLTSGLSLKQFAGPTALQFTAGCWGGCDGLSASLDLLANMPAIASGDALTVAWNVGAGGALGAGEDGLGAAAALIAGLEFNLQVLPFDFVLEWRPGIHILPEPEIELIHFGGHIRFYPW